MGSVGLDEDCFLDLSLESTPVELDCSHQELDFPRLLAFMFVQDVL